MSEINIMQQIFSTINNKMHFTHVARGILDICNKILFKAKAASGWGVILSFAHLRVTMLCSDAYFYTELAYSFFLL